MSSVPEGVYTLHINNVKTLLDQDGLKNENYRKAGSYKQIIPSKHGPFTSDAILWEIYAYPFKQALELYLRVKHNNGPEIKKYGYVNLQENHYSNREWYPSKTTKLGHEVVFRKSDFATKMGLNIVLLDKVSKDSMQKCASKDGTYIIKMAIWFILDSSWKPRWNVCDWKSADIHFVTKGVTFPAHSAVLMARSSVFRSKIEELKKDHKQDSPLPLTIDEIGEFTLIYLLYFIYTDSLHPDLKNDATAEKYQNLINAAGRYDLKNLKALCEKERPKGGIRTLNDFEKNNYERVSKIF